jgi:hypothetical protein
MKTIVTTILLMFVVSFSYAGQTTADEARKTLSETIQTVMHEEMNHYPNFFYKNDVSLLKEKAVVTFWVNADKKLELIKVESKDPDAIKYVKYIFNTQNMTGDKSLVGLTFRMNLDLRYETF